MLEMIQRATIVMKTSRANSVKKAIRQLIFPTLNHRTLNFESIWTIFNKYGSCIEVEIQQRAVEYLTLSSKGAALMDILAEMPKFPEQQSALIKKAEDTELDTAEQSAIKLRTQQQAQTSNALVVTDQPMANGIPPVNQLGLVKMPIISCTVPIGNIAERFHALCLKDSGVLYEDPYIQIGIKAEWRAHHGRLVLFLGNKNTSSLASVQAIILPPSHLKTELSLVPETIPPRAQVQCPLEVINLHPSRDVAVLDFSYKFGNEMANVKLRLPAVLNKFLQPLSVSPEEFFPQWRSLSGPPLKLQEVVRGVKPLPLLEMANLFNSYRLTISPRLGLWGSEYEGTI
ncbi:hypothetical protein K1719_034285 [Acacia pycnantha]|nr:hypothetical protein K1719_034285 [Acacia pycnantha]